MATEKVIEQQMLEHLDSLTKPRGSLGKLEEYALKMAKIQGKVPPRVGKKGIYVFAGDHGIAEEGVSLSPQEVTRQMVTNMIQGGAGINAIGEGAGWEIAVVDAGVKGDGFPDAGPDAKSRLIRAKIVQGSRNFYREPALTAEEVVRAMAWGADLAKDAEDRGYYLVAIGDLGIGNTATAAAMLTAAGFLPEDMVDRGTNIDNAMLDHKRQVVTEAVARWKCPPSDGEAILTKLGSADYAMMAGFILGLEDRGIGCVLDGFPVSSAAYMAYLINPMVLKYLFAGHLSKVRGHGIVLTHMRLEPIVSLDMHLGEGTGAAIGGQIIELALLSALNMASFKSAGVSGGDLQGERY
ncbi:MAG: nicotinate-nucleotide--dimethylbenzimidazole phosphoribosyltransferase [Spirochaetaceae bacterium]|jgi:nicotinate-nucleotide--dimethylbenzimidazole phosphoribosyltransferase|nr:nicotinate-nucleotide--dimethylbenzimidazole phosphoribosyltransferase [Spirochaetaceae bacterium]